MRELESKYWDEKADKRVVRSISDNIWKRSAIAHRIYAHKWSDSRVLEIGVGFGSIVATMRIIFLDNFKYVGTDVSPIFCQKCKDYFSIDLINTDVLGVPEIEGGYTRIIALDTLEHVHPDDRDEGYRRIGHVAAPNVTMFINIPLEETRHDREFDHPFGLSDVNRLCELASMRLTNYEEYTITIPFNGSVRAYGWTILKRGDGG